MMARKSSARLTRLESLATNSQQVRSFGRAIQEICASRLLEAFALLGFEPPAHALQPTAVEWAVVAESQQSGLLRLPDYSDLKRDQEGN